jgi:hypothetical protein
VGEGEERAFSFAAEFIAVGAISGSHESSAAGGFIGALFAMREAEGVAEFVADAADEDGIVLAEGDAAVFAIADDGFFEREVFGVELGGVQLPGGAALVITAGVVRRVVDKGEFFRIPASKVTKDDEGFFFGVDAGFSKDGETFFADVAAGAFLVVGCGMVAFDEVDLDLAVWIAGEVDGAGAKAEAVHFFSVEVLEVLHDATEARFVLVGRFAVVGGPEDEVEGAFFGAGRFLMPGVEDDAGVFRFFGFAGNLCGEESGEEEGNEI